MADEDPSSRREARRKKFREWRDFYVATSIGLHFVVSIFIGFGIGYLMDGWLGTRPWMMVLFILFGVGAGFFNLIRVSLDQDRRNLD
jgi:ATP synthase protein I